MTLVPGPPIATDGRQFYAGAAVAMSNIAAGFTEIFGGTNRRMGADLTGWTHTRVATGGGVNGNAGAVMQVRASVDGGSNFTAIAEVSIASHTTTNVPGSWTAIPAALRRDVILQVGTSGGDGAADPTFGHVTVEFGRF